MSSTLRSSVIRLASTNPALRPHLLPLLKQATSIQDFTYLLVLGAAEEGQDVRAIMEADPIAKVHTVRMIGEGLLTLDSNKKITITPKGEREKARLESALGFGQY